ncbi:MBOAT family O-acyltransferase [Pseudobutyrivibrio xylanivorans]|uniref:D-alanyl-lipoteichoic acid acyltransferase DltB, MBOAT superfamily n=1 Tax=Pseudobutyrivibrio xylanivorans DSM 14809 TaxID=1123012 RepID=A0A1M6JQ36_PSEXY|nr:MBOAT family O-acyltransferase [Pseudobutyrivibrio xylanivorans]SHJ48790.1 D-alanyl-lipoteichoic acid acyltransferase DltB, MBOAT superfamily [Pseudobutyrivibrio xylanivorans DSM 14809]
MLFNSSHFLVFFPIVILGYYIISSKFRYIWLLVASYYFYIQWNPAYVLLLFFSTAITYVGALVIEKITVESKRKLCLFSVIFVNLAILGYFKYSSMFISYINKILIFADKKEIPWDYSIILPVGISFYTLQALGYLIDVYRKDIYAEHNFLRYALFISFFPQLVAGPIERSKNLLKQLAVPKRFSYENLRRGLIIMLYGFFLKVVIADRVAIFVNTVYKNPSTFNGYYIIIATMLFAIQIYCDFYGYSTIAKGVALTLGISLMDNFNAPYFSKSIKEFWRRWHISLSTWFRDYLYIPLGGNRKGTARKYLNLMIVFCVSGLWHGASMSFVIWGAMHGIYQIVEGLINKTFNKLKERFKDFLK